LLDFVWLFVYLDITGGSKMGQYCRSYQDKDGKEVKIQHDWHYDEQFNECICQWCDQTMGEQAWFKVLSQKVKDLVK
jgi:hypothetical protein